jgi:hypothetical protein
LGLTFQVGFFFRPALCLDSVGPLDTDAPLTGHHSQCQHDRDPADILGLHAYATFIRVYSLNLFLFRWRVLEIENVLLEPVAGGHDRLSTSPPTPGPPSKTIPKRDTR